MANDETSVRPGAGGGAWLTQPGRLLRLAGSLLAAAFVVALLRFVALGVEDSLGTAFQLVITIGYGTYVDQSAWTKVAAVTAGVGWLLLAAATLALLLRTIRTALLALGRDR
ncbi:MAG: hypothetical protein KDB73_17255 [Planctomycetes bacterium]|nr:hypothetical protein [Planctomycetota bacterium]